MDNVIAVIIANKVVSIIGLCTVFLFAIMIFRKLLRFAVILFVVATVVLFVVLKFGLLEENSALDIREGMQDKIKEKINDKIEKIIK